ncbi:MAG: HAD-IB family phosphatase [Anaerolineales bacterium]|nr:HAD-IB family phosphatase [Anaerolineales bacterium]
MHTPIVAFDLEGTLSAGQAWRGLRGYLEANGRSADFRAFLRPRLPRVLLYRLGLLNRRRFQEGWIVDLLRLFAGLTPEELAAVGRWVVDEELWPRRRRAVVAELARHRDAGRQVLIVTGIIQPILDEFAARLAVTGRGTAVSFVDGRFTGAVPHLNTGDHKVAYLRQLTDGRPLAAAYGDTVADIPMLAMSETAVVVHPDKRLRRVADARGWRVMP